MTTFADIGKKEALKRLRAGESFGAETAQAHKLLLEGVDFNLVYFPFKHLGYKAVTAVTGELYSQMRHPSELSVVLGVSSKLDYPQIEELWAGIGSAAKEHGYKNVSLDLQPSQNGLCISVSACGERSNLTEVSRPKAQSKDLLCVSGCLGAAYLGLRLLEREKRTFEAGGPGGGGVAAGGTSTADGAGVSRSALETYRMLVGAYLKPELPAGALAALEEAGIYPSAGCFITHGLADAVKRLALQTGLGAKVYADKIPFEGNSFQLGRELDIDPVSAAMNGGDDFRILWAVPILSLEKFRRDFQTFDIIGHLALPEAGTVLVTPDGAELPLRAPGWPED